MKASVSVYMRDQQVIVVPQGGGGGLYYDLDDVKVVAPSEPELQQALEDALQASIKVDGQPLPDLRTRKWTIPKRLGVKSVRAFYTNVSHANIILRDGKIEIFADRPAKDNKGFEPDRGPFLIDNISLLGSFVLRILRDAPRICPA
jgi:hypothetical protein